jgi:hypothetical protein
MSGPPRTLDEAIDAQLATIAFPVARIAFMNVTYQPQADTPYLRSSMASRTRKALTLGVDQSLIPHGGYMARWDGVYQVDAVWPENAGQDGCGEMQSQILRLFPRGTTLVSSDGLNIVFEVPEPLPIRPDPGGGWVRGPVRCPWFCFEAS